MREDTVRSAAILREARLRAGFSQDELGRVAGKDRTVIARYEQGIVAPSLDTLVQLLRACGFDLPLELLPYDPGPDETIGALQMLSPERRLDRMLDLRRAPEDDPVLEEQRQRLREALRAEEARERELEEHRRAFLEGVQRRKEDRLRREDDRRRTKGGD
ncbi:MAG TPA: helix-turn-helix transcriptional regulator [Polyangiaceae bacterium]|nr:helix-turn-helix transcriptional regulator [Polyangiaceae bacterium]